MNGYLSVLGKITWLGLCTAFFSTPLADETAKGKTGELQTEVSGTIRYQADSKRPWRFGRYYVNGPEKKLAEAVVELVPSEANATFPATPDRKIKTHLMDQENFMFIPETLAVQLGDKVLFKNSEEAYHNVMCLDDKPPFNVNLAKGQTHTHTPQVAGGAKKPLNIRCVFHGAMKGWIFVFPHAYFHQTDKKGTFQFKGFPPGKYKLRIAHPSGELYFETKAKHLETGKADTWDMTLTPDHLIKNDA